VAVSKVFVGEKVSVGVPTFVKGAPKSKGWLNIVCVCGGDELCGLEV
jgi:hypothetical protein